MLFGLVVACWIWIAVSLVEKAAILRFVYTPEIGYILPDVRGPTCHRCLRGSKIISVDVRMSKPPICIEPEDEPFSRSDKTLRMSLS